MKIHQIRVLCTILYYCCHIVIVVSVDDTMDAILSGDEDEEDEVIGQVLDEIGLEYTSKV